jgi:hypothetical protein
MFRERAEEIRSFAGVVRDKTASAGYVGLAEVYEELAAIEDEQAARLADDTGQ